MNHYKLLDKNIKCFIISLYKTETAYDNIFALQYFVSYRCENKIKSKFTIQTQKNCTILCFSR